MKNCCRTLLALLLAVSVCFSVAACGTDNTAENEITVKTTYNTLAVERSEDIASFRNGRFSISAAQGEADGAQVIVNPSNDVSAYTATVSDLTDADGNTISAENCTLYVQIYARVINGTNDFPAGYYPDCLIPVEYITAAGENSIGAGQNQGFWLDVFVPYDTAAGEYAGYVTFAFDGQQIAVPVSVEVFDFAMPETPTIETSYLIWKDWLIYGELDGTVEKWKTYFDFLIDFNICGYDLPVEIGDIEGYKAAVREYYDKLAAYFIPFKIEGNLEIDTDLMYRYIYAIAEISLEDGVNYFDKAKYYIHTIYDECNHDSVYATRYPKAEQVLREVGELEEKVIAQLKAEGKAGSGRMFSETVTDEEFFASIRDIPHVMTTTYDENLALNYGVDTFCPSYSNFITTDSIAFYQDLMEQGYTIYSYSAANRGVVGSQLINDYTIAGRDIFWSKYAYGIKGDLYWNLTGYLAWWQFVGRGYGLLNDLYTQASHDGLTNGDGYMLYPGKQYGSDSPFPSLRLMMRRDGIDDYDYMSLLEEEYAALSAAYGAELDVRTSLESMYDRIFSLSASKLNYQGLADMRALLARFIELAQSDAGFAVEKIEAGTDAIECSFYVKPGYTVTINGVEYTGISAGGGNKITARVPYGESGTLRVKVAGSGYSSSFTFTLGEKPEEGNSFADEASLSAVSVAATYGSTVAVNTDRTYALSETSLKAELSGHLFDNESYNSSFHPYVYFDVDGLTGIEYVTFCVYNASDEDFTVQVVALDDFSTYSLDEVALPARSWTTVKVGNFTQIDADGAGLADILQIGLSAKENLLDEDAAVYSRTLYIDEFYIKNKV